MCYNVSMAEWHEAQLARTHGLIIQRNHLLEISMRCILVKLENVESLVSSAYQVIKSNNKIKRLIR